MRVLMVQTPSVETFTSEKVYPIGIVLLAGVLKKKGHQVEILDLNLDHDPYGVLQEKLLEFRPEVVGFSLRNIDPLGNKNTSLIPQFTAAVRLTALLLPEALLIAGGTGFSLFPERIMQELSELDYGIVGEGEHSFPALLESLGYPVQLPGLCYREGEEVRLLPPSTDIDMACYLPPDRTLWDIKPYLDLNNYTPSIGIETKRGCPFNCSYCVYPQLQGRHLRRRSAADVVDEVEFLHKEYGVKQFHFNDPVINIPRGHLEGICREILKRKLKIRWDGFFREDHLDAENIALFEEAGCECFSFSPDGLCQEALDVLGKQETEDDILKAARLAASRDVLSVYHFMVNVPGENQRTIEKGVQMLERIYDLHAPKRNLGTIVLNNIRIMPGTRIEKIAREEGVITPDTDLLYPVYFNPRPYDTLRYRLESFHFCKNVFMWKGVDDK
ncbi:B12 lower ligand biosynthesis radical SAM protein BzaD [Syntrophaceticus schinkii]|jgi:anaerobic magnesium-protoporphyrin IX monomethyl ester cyclase|nr:B12 lower ligand biosynthesis radical SAM protein BzaD [Syntrophaceticus schinkii]MDD4261769.1 B12 lower ligand biosynthesis radical SAM protein BzaD [Syntrophaceticus schinkii]